MKVRCIRPFGHHKPGDVAEVPDGAAVDPHHYRPVSDPPAPPALAHPSGLQILKTPAEGAVSAPVSFPPKEM